MSKFFKINVSIIAAIFFLAGISASFAQTNNNLFKVSTQKTDGKLFRLNAMNEKVFELTLSGVKSVSDIDLFKTNLLKQSGIRLVTIIPTVAADYLATVTLVPEAKVKDFKQALINLGYSSIIIDGEPRLLSEPEK